LRTKSEIRTNLRNTTRETQINSTIDEFINLTLQEINDPAWAFDAIKRYGVHHLWSFNRRKSTFDTVADQEFYQLPRDLDKISLVRQIDSPIKLKYYPDHLFYKYIPYPTATGSPKVYRLWEEEGVETRLAVADTIDIVSSSTSDDSNYSVTVVGKDTNGIIQSNSYTLNGTTAVAGTITFAANQPLRISKSATTNGDITATENSGGTTLVILGKEERSPRFKVAGLYPIPSSAITIYLEYYTRIRRLENDTDVPDIDTKWIWVVRLGALAKIENYQKKPDAISTQRMYAAGVRSMVKSDLSNTDEIPVLESGYYRGYAGKVELGDENFSLTF
jgi:hypothetical protein